VRLRSPENIVREIVEYKSGLPLMGDAYLEVETLGANRQWALELCSALEEMNRRFDVPVTFGTNLRVTPNTDFEELFDALEAANFRFINIGLESGCERIRRDVLKRNYSNQDIINAVGAARKRGLQVGIYNLIGLPGETPADFNETIRMNRICQPDWYLLSVFFPYPGTALNSTCAELGLLNGKLDHKLERRRPVLDLPDFRKGQIRRRVTWSPLLFYGGSRKPREIARLIIYCRIFASPRLLGAYRAYRERRNPYRVLEDA